MYHYRHRASYVGNVSTGTFCTAFRGEPRSVHARTMEDETTHVFRCVSSSSVFDPARPRTALGRHPQQRRSANERKQYAKRDGTRSSTPFMYSERGSRDIEKLAGRRYAGLKKLANAPGLESWIMS